MEEALLKRWRLILGGNEADGTGVSLSAEESRVDAALNALYDSDRKGGLSGSAPKVSRWLGDIREFFPQTVVQVIQKDAIKRLNLTSLLTEKEMLESVVPDVHLVATLMSLSRVIPEKNKVIAREVVRKVVDELMKKLSSPMQQAVTGALNRSSRRRNPRYNEIDWKTTIEKNLRNYQPEYKTDLQDPVDLLFGVQLGGGTDIDRALGYCQTVITRPADTVLVLVTDLCEGGNEREMRKKMISLVQSGVQLIVLLALNDDGAPFYDKENAQFLAELGVPAFACTPDKFPDLMAAALAKQDIGMWLSKNIQ